MNERVGEVEVVQFVEDFLPRRAITGGAPISIRYQVEGLAQTHRVVVVAPRKIFPPLARYRASRGTPVADASDDPANLQVLRPRYFHLPVLWPLTEPLQLAILGFVVVLTRARGARILHGHRAFPMGLAAVLVARLSGRLAVITAHGSDVHRDALEGPLAVRLWSRFALRHAHRVVAVSRHLKEILLGMGLTDSQTTYIPNGVDPTRFDLRSRDSARRKLDLDEGAPTFLSIGGLLPVKGHSVLLRAFARAAERLAAARLLILGDGPLRNALQEEAGALGLQSRVRFLGRVAYAEIPDWIAASDALVLPSFGEGTPLVALEALCSGRPVIGTAVGGIPEVVEDGRHGLLVPPGDVTALAEAMVGFAAATWSEDELRARGLSFAWPQLVPRIRRVYLELLGTTPDPT